MKSPTRTPKRQKGNIEQAMVFFFKKLTDNYLVREPRYMSKEKKDSLWESMCNWCHEYINSLPTGDK